MKNTGFLWSLLLAGLLLFACSERDDTQPDDDDTSEADPCDNCFPEGEVVPACTETSQCTGWIYGNSLCGPDGFCELGVPECWECEDDPADDDDDFDWEDPPIFLASYDFSLVMLDNQITQSFSVIFGQMDISVSSTAFLAEMVTETGETWDWGGSLDSNAQQFLVGGWMRPPGATEDIRIEVAGNFVGDADGSPSESCMAGIGRDDDPSLPDAGIEFSWYGCQQQAPASAIDRSGVHAVAVTVHGDNCAAWSQTSWTEDWVFQGRRLIVMRDGYLGYGIVSDDGNKFHFTMLEQETPGRSLKVVGDFTNPNGTTEARATGYCTANSTEQVGAVLDMDY